MSAGPDPERLRRDALEALGPYGDPRARDALTWGALVVVPNVSAWDASAGRVYAHRVEIGITPDLLTAFAAAPAAHDALIAAVAAAIARAPGESLAELRLFLGGPARHSPYRDP